MKKTAIILSSIVGVLLVAALIIPSFIDWKKYEPQARQALVKATGFDAEIAGGLGLSLLPSPRLTVSDVKLYEPSFKDQPLVELKTAKVILSPFSLLFGQVDISSVVLENGNVWLYKNEAGRANWEAQRPDNAADSGNNETATQASEGENNSRVKIDQVYLSNIDIRYEDMTSQTSHVAKIKDADVKMDSLSGPYNVSSEISYGEQIFDIAAKVGNISNKDNMPLSFTLESDGGAKISYSGAANFGDSFDAQGELDIAIANVSKFMASLPGGASAPSALDNFALKGMASITEERVSLRDGALNVNNTPADISLELSGLNADIVTLSTKVEFKEVMNLEFLEDKVQELQKNSAKSSAGQKTGAANNNKILPESVNLPHNFKANINLIVPGVKYNGKTTGKVELVATFDDKNLKGGIQAFSLPAQTNFRTDMALTFASKAPIADSNMSVYANPVFKADTAMNTQSLRGVIVDWLGVAANTDIPQQMPDNVNINTALNVTPYEARVDLKDVNFGQTAVKGYVAYKLSKSGNALPLIEADIQSGNLVLPDLLSSDGKAGSGNASVSSSAEAKALVPEAAKNIPYNLDVKLAMDKLVLGAKEFRNIALDIEKQGSRLSINNAKIGNYLDASIALSGVINNYEQLSGLNLSMALNSANIDTFLNGHNITVPASIPSPIGAMKLDVSIDGEMENANYKGSVSAYGFSGSIAGSNLNLLRPQIPQVMQLSLTHPDSEKAIQFLHKDYKAQSNLMNGAFKFNAKVNHTSQVTDITGLTLKLGPSTMTGGINVKHADIPYVKANLNVDTLPVDVLAGAREKISNSGSATAQSQATRAEGQTPWSRDAIDTSILRAVQADLAINAQKFSYGHSILKNAQVTASLKNGILDVSRIAGQLDEGELSGKVVVRAPQAGKPIEMQSSFALTDATVRSVSKLVTGKTTRKLNGGMALNVDMTATGLSSAALISALNGQGRFQVINPVLEGVDVKAIYNTLKSIDNFQGALTGFLQSTTSSGSTQFNSVDKEFQIVNGVIPIDNWDANSDHAVLLSNGKIDFPNWKIDINNTIQIQGVENLPSFGMRIYGPLDAPQTVVTRQALEDFLQSKIGNRVRDVITDKLVSEKFQGKMKDKLGVGLEDVLPFGTRENAAEPATDGAEQATPTESDDPKKKLLKGLFNELTK